MLGLEELAHAPLELGRARAGRQPAGADRLRDGCDLLFADRRAAGTRGSSSAGPERRAPASAVTKRMRSAAASARASGLLAGSPDGEERPRPVGAAAERVERRSPGSR